MNSLILVRGLPGSGKSTLADLLAEGGKYPVFSVDHYFTDVAGSYNFQFDKNHIAYSECVEKTKAAMQNGETKVIVDNTFTMDWEMEPYFKLASEFNYRLHVVTVEKYHEEKNIHAIPDEHIERMAAKYKVKLY